MKIGKLPGKIRVMIVKVIQDLGKRMEAQTEKIQEMFKKELEDLKNKQTEMNNTITKMRRQRNMLQMKEQGKNPQHQTNEQEIGSLPEKEFRVMILRMIQILGNRMEKRNV